jgi:hypothetical protein
MIAQQAALGVSLQMLLTDDEEINYELEKRRVNDELEELSEIIIYQDYQEVMEI